MNGLALSCKEEEEGDLGVVMTRGTMCSQDHPGSARTDDLNGLLSLQGKDNISPALQAGQVRPHLGFNIQARDNQTRLPVKLREGRQTVSAPPPEWSSQWRGQ